ncbi:hypothetical protein PhCBS80983_g04053 [Powellomyces hirtus]|uniref:HNH nuclease domain-containing protein n=1 Tax=Powellomyces hirtus TaxID=109895 RepID=A0A507E0C0_9FUNG|nr:hypothetical protein PhCBS80983_g04053 [Powellomyces hirtus]
MRSRDDAKGLQAAMRAHCMRRDQCCVLSGRCEDVVLKCSHVLTPEYGAKWFAEELDRGDFLCSFPTVAGRYLPAFDIKNGVIMSADLHESFDAFRFSIWPRDNKFFVHLFYPVTGLRHGQEVTTPHILPNGPTPNYFRDLFPEPEVFLAHFAQAVLFNMRGAGEAYIPSNDSGDYTDDDIFANLSEDLQFHWWDSEQELARKIVRRDQLRRSCARYQYEVEQA